MSMAFVPTAPAQVPGEVQGVICTVSPSGVPVDLGTLSGTHSGTSSYGTPGSSANVAVFTFCGVEGDAIEFMVDNVDTPSDLWACVTAGADDPCDPPFYNDIMNDLGGDDEVGCTVPHFFGCPAGQAPLPADDGDGIYVIRVGTWSSAGDFAGSVSVNGANVLVLPA